VLYVDSENLRPFDRNRVLTQVRGFLGDIMYPHVQVMVVSYQRSIKIITPFTTDKTRVMDSLRSLYKVATGRPEQDNERNKIIRELARLKDKGMQKGSQPSNDLLMIQGDIQGFADKSANDLEFAINAIREISTSLSGFEGRKWLVHISNGLAMIPGRDLFHDFSQVYQSASTLNFMMRYDMKSWYDTLASAANAQGVSFLTIDASGLGGSSRVSAEHIRPVDPITDTIHLNNHQETLQYLAERTGGRTILSANDVTPGLQAFRTDLFSYYSLGYTISASGSDRVHRIKVELVDQPGYDLNYRRNFVEKSLESRVQDAVITGLMYDLDQNPMKIDTVTLASRPAAEDRWMVPLEVSVPLESIALVPHRDEYVGQIVFFVAARDEKGRQSDLQRREQEVRIPASEYEERRGDWVTLTLDMLMEEGTYRVAVGVLDRITRQAAYQTLNRQVPGSL
jgi:VWFA-related protein